MRSAWRGEARKSSEPNREMSNFEPPADIISIAEQARPNDAGQIELLRPQSTSFVRSHSGFPGLSAPAPAPMTGRIRFIRDVANRATPLVQERCTLSLCALLLLPLLSSSRRDRAR